jgi:branched-chain amino acid transport system substrate-binding protein
MRSDPASAAALAAMAVCVVQVASACGGAGSREIRIGMITACDGPFGVFSEATTAGAELPFLARGATLHGRKASQGITSARVAGKRVSFVRACQGGSFASMIAAARRLVERDGVDAVVGPLAVPYATALRRYAERRPETVFSIALSGEQGVTLKRPGANVFRFNQAEATWMAGLAAYAYRTLGWRTAATIGEDNPSGWSETAGFVAEFCALGGKIVKRIWSPFFSSDLSRLVPEIPAGADGVLLGDGSQAVDSFLDAYRKRHPDIGRHVLTGAFSLFFVHLDDRVRGLVVGTPFLPGSGYPPWRRYAAAITKSFPGLAGPSGFDLSYYDATEPLLEALEAVRGDLSDGGRRFRQALQELRFDAPNGPIHLDRNRQAVGPNFLLRIEMSGGKFRAVPFRVVPNVEQTFGGYFSGSSPEPSRTQPACVRRPPPVWAR